jgi:outer membrane receptor protein involved in Fe transport
MAELPHAMAQTAPVSTTGVGVIEGSISTQQSTPLAGAHVTIIDATGRIVADASSDSEGRFRVADLTAGTYRVMAALDGFETTTQSVLVSHERAAVITVDLPIARFADTIDVVGETTAVSSGQTLAPVEAIASRELDQFVPGQGFQGAIRMLSTVIPVPGGVSIKGGRPGQAGVQLGTTTLVDPASGVAQVPLPDGAIESVTVLPNPYAVEYGRFSSGLVVIQSRRGRDAWKLRANRFGPSFRSTSDGGFRIDGFSPRAEMEGPLVKDRVYLAQSVQARYSIGDQSSLAETDQRVTKALSSFSRVDANLSPKPGTLSQRGRLRDGRHVYPARGLGQPAHPRQAGVADGACAVDEPHRERDDVSVVPVAYGRRSAGHGVDGAAAGCHTWQLLQPAAPDDVFVSGRSCRDRTSRRSGRLASAQGRRRPAAHAVRRHEPESDFAHRARRRRGRSSPRLSWK